MTTKKSDKKKPSAARKLIPAIGMLTVSAMMLSTSTYAWFTMSREVEVKNIQMTASVPEDLQISLGKLTDISGQGAGNPNSKHIASNRATDLGLQGNQGILLGADSKAADNGNVVAPPNNSATAEDAATEFLHWANTVDISEYYRLGKIIPASSIDGGGIYFTPDASGNGTTLKADAKYYQAASLASADFSTLFKWNSTSKKFVTSEADGDPARTTLHAINKVDATADTWNPANPEGASTNGYVGASEWFDTNDDGYYVDIPIWLRSSAKENTSLSVDAFVTTNAAKTEDADAAHDDELYMAARAAIIYVETPASDADSSAVDKSTGLLRIRKDSFANTTSIIDYMYSTNNTGDAIKQIADVNGLPTGVTYDNATQYDGTAVITVPGRDEGTANKYGYMVKAVIRVWLEGEDPNCWNPNAGQDFNISLKFVKNGIGSTTTATDNANGVLYPAAWVPGDHAHADSDMAVDSSTVVTISAPSNKGTDTLQFTFNGLSGADAKWNLTDGSFEILDGHTYKIAASKTVTGNNAAITSTADIATWLKNNVTNKDIAGGTFTISDTTSGT